MKKGFIILSIMVLSLVASFAVANADDIPAHVLNATYKMNTYIKELREVKQKMQEQGYYDAPVNGNYNNKTVECVKRYQKDHGLAQTGQIDKAFLEALYMTKATETPTVRATYTPRPTAIVTVNPTSKPTAKPTIKPTIKPTPKPTVKPTEKTNVGEYSITLDKSTVSVKNGESVTVTVHVDAPEGASYSIGGSYENKYVCSTSFGKEKGNDHPLVITGTGYGVSTVTVYVKGHPETEKVITVNVSMSKEERVKSQKVQYISDRSFFFYDNEDVFVLMFSFKDKDEKRIDAPAKVDIRIENDNGVVVYEKTRYVNAHDFGTWTSTFYGERYMAAVYISPEDIIEGSSSTGNVFFTVTTGDSYFDESKVSASKLPKSDLTKQCSLDMPSLPRELTYSSSSGKVYSKVNVTQMTYEFKEDYDGTVRLTLYFSGNKTYDYKGNNNSSSCEIGWKLYDKQGYVIETGTCYTSALETGEKFKNEKDSIYNLEPGHYSIKLINVE